MPFDLLSSSWYVTVDGVMGGQSSGSVTSASAGGINWSGFLSTDGGGFVYISRSGMSGLNLQDRTGLLFDLGSLAGDAPLALQVELEGRQGCCGRAAAIAVPATAMAGEAATAFVPLGDMKPKGPWYAPNSCSCTVALSAVRAVSIGLYYQQGPYSLDLRGITATDTDVSADALIHPPLPGAAVALAAALERADYLATGALLAEEQMDQLALAVLETAAAQGAGSETLNEVARQQLAAAAAAAQAARWTVPASPSAGATLSVVRSQFAAATQFAAAANSGGSTCGAAVAMYALSASASSEYPSAHYVASNAAGAPTHAGSCGVQMGGSWAPAVRDTAAHTLTLEFAAALHVHGVVVHEHANPASAAGFVRAVELISSEADGGAAHVVWAAAAGTAGADGTACGGSFGVDLPAPTAYRASRVRLTTQTAVAAWEYVDAVELRGTPCLAPPTAPPPRAPPPPPSPPPSTPVPPVAPFPPLGPPHPPGAAPQPPPPSAPPVPPSPVPPPPLPPPSPPAPPPSLTAVATPAPPAPLPTRQGDAADTAEADLSSGGTASGAVLSYALPPLAVAAMALAAFALWRRRQRRRQAGRQVLGRKIAELTPVGIAVEAVASASTPPKVPPVSGTPAALAA